MKKSSGQQSSKSGSHAGDADHSLVARGSILAFVGRMGALIEAVSFVVFANLYGEVYFGLFILLWSYVHVASIISDFGMTSALQRFIPLQKTEDGAHVVLRNAIAVSLPVSLVFATLMFAAAPLAAEALQTDDLPAATLTGIIRLYVWAIPLWTFVDVTTAAIRARRVFGPEIRVRIFYEQMLRFIAGVGFFYLGWETYGMFAAHVASFAATALLSIRLVSRYYQLGKVIRPPRGPDQIRVGAMARFGFLMILPNVSKKLHAYLPVYFLNFLIPGTAGVTIVGIYAMARKIVSVLQVIRDSFEYVLAPVASAKKSAAAYQSLSDIYAFSTRFICASFIPAATLVIVFSDNLLALAGPQYLAGSGALVVLVMGRLVEAATGPSSAIISMIGRYRLPLINAAGGIAVTIFLLWLLIAPLGLVGAATAAAVGLNVTSIAALAQVHLYHGLRAFNRRLTRPVLISALVSAAMAGLIILAAGLGIWVKVAAGFATLGATFWSVLRYGFDKADLAAIFPKGKR